MIHAQLETLSKTKAKKLRKLGVQIVGDVNFSEKPARPSLTLKDIRPKTINQNKIFKAWNAGRQIFAHGYPGTGKTFLALYLALNDILNKNSGQRIVIVRSAVPSRNIGFMPGSKDEKMAVYEGPYISICGELFGRGDAYQQLKQKKIIEFLPTSFNRGLTLNDTIFIVDETQNLSFNELDTTITRVGENSRIIFCGDHRQSDFIYEDDAEGLHKFMKVIRRMDEFSFFELGIEDIVRSGLVKNYIIAKMNK